MVMLRILRLGETLTMVLEFEEEEGEEELGGVGGTWLLMTLREIGRVVAELDDSEISWKLSTSLPGALLKALLGERIDTSISGSWSESLFLLLKSLMQDDRRFDFLTVFCEEDKTLLERCTIMDEDLPAERVEAFFWHWSCDLDLKMRCMNDPHIPFFDRLLLSGQSVDLEMVEDEEPVVKGVLYGVI